MTDWVVPLPLPRAQIVDATEFRSTWITASRATLRERGLFEKYERALDPADRTELATVVPGLWLPMKIARTHYAACDTLGLHDDELVEIGRLAMRRANATTLSFITRLAKNAGVTPWTALAQAPRITAQTMNGGAICVARVGPKDAQVEIIGYPLGDLRYNRVTMRGILQGLIEHFCRKAYSRELPELCDRRSTAMRLSWA